MLIIFDQKMYRNKV